MTSIVILGSGLAGINLAREFRKLDTESSLTVVTADDGNFYSKPMLSNGLTAKKTPAQLVLTQKDALATMIKADLRVHTQVQRILPDEHAVETSGGRIEYTKLVLALGAQPFRLPLEGDGAADVLSVNSLGDYTKYREKLEGKTKIALLGAGLIGCEFANDLRGTGAEVDSFDVMPQALGRLLPPQAAAFFKKKNEEAGIRFHFDTSVVRVDRDGAGYRLTDSKGNTWNVDLVISAVGLKPAIELAQAAGLKVNRGICVNKLLATSNPDIHALGDCAEVEGLVLPFVMPIMQCVQALSKTLNGTPTEVRYPAMPVSVKTPFCATAVCPPPVGANGAWREEATDTGVKSLFEDASGNPLGFALMGDKANDRVALAPKMPAWL